MRKGPNRPRPGRGRGRSDRDRGDARDRTRSSRQAGGFDWSVADDDDEFEGDDEDHGGERYEDEDEDRPRRRGPRRRSATARRPDKKTLMDLCTPVFGYAAMLPPDPAAAQPDYEQFRNQVLAALNRIQADASEHGIEAEDARQACYALSFFLDTQVAQSKWTGKERWSGEPLGIVLQQDPEGGVNFFRRLDAFGDRQSGVKEVFLVCLAMGFRGKYAEQDAATQAAQIAAVRQKIVRSIHPEPMDKQGELFPEAYQPAGPIADEIPPPPRWWWFASLGITVLALLIWFGLFLWAGGSSRTADEVVARESEQIRDRGPRRPSPPATAVPPAAEPTGADVGAGDGELP